MEERLQKFLASNGVASRRKCEELILQGEISVNGKVVTELGSKINPEKDIVTYNGKKVEKSAQDFVYILLNKPIGVVTTAKDQFGRDSVLDLVKVPQRVVPVGRLDMYTSGALILTNDGKIRKLTPRECFNIQGFPRDFVLPENASNTRLYKQAGNSVVVPVIKRIAEAIADAIK